MSIFALSGLRGIIGEDLTVPDLQDLGGKFGSLMHGGRCAVGKDRDKVVSGSSLSVVRDIESLGLRVVTNISFLQSMQGWAIGGRDGCKHDER